MDLIEIKNRLETVKKFNGQISNYQYLNGNYVARGKLDNYSFSPNLEKIGLRINEDLVSAFPDSIDLKITNICSWGCPFCHENSVASGKSFNLENTIKMLKQLPEVQIELAIGGGDILECPDIKDFLIWLNNETAFLPRITLNYKNVIKYIEGSDKKYSELFEEVYFLTSGNMGISITGAKPSDITMLQDTFAPSPIYHIIAGLFPPEELEKMLYWNTETAPFMSQNKGILVLGYKQFGRASKTELPNSLKETEIIIKKFLHCQEQIKKTAVVSFDNLAIEQLHITEKDVPNWNTLYMGEEGEHSMYVDAVNETFAKTSRSTKRVPWSECSIIDFFNKQKNDTVNY